MFYAFYKLALTPSMFCDSCPKNKKQPSNSPPCLSYSPGPYLESRFLFFSAYSNLNLPSRSNLCSSSLPKTGFSLSISVPSISKNYSPQFRPGFYSPATHSGVSFPVTSLGRCSPGTSIHNVKLEGGNHIHPHTHRETKTWEEGGLDLRTESGRSLQMGTARL